jgi:hypothetical protein
MRSIWDNIDDPKYNTSGTGPRLPYLYPGKFLMSVKKISHYPSKKNPRDEWFRVDLDIVEGAKDGQSEVSWVVNLSKGDYALRDVVAFVSALLGEETRINRDVMEHLEGADQPAAGMLVRCEALNKKTQAGGDFTQTYWSAVEA